jgi:hypothetical protein
MSFALKEEIMMNKQTKLSRLNKTIVLVVLTLFLLISFANIALAGDTPEAIMEGNQKALFIGMITKISNNNITVTPKTILMGDIS